MKLNMTNKLKWISQKNKLKYLEFIITSLSLSLSLSLSSSCWLGIGIVWMERHVYSRAVVLVSLNSLSLSLSRCFSTSCWLGIGILCLNGATCLLTSCCIGEPQLVVGIVQSELRHHFGECNLSSLYDITEIGVTGWHGIQINVSERGDMSTRGLLFQWAII